jgi:hypothetical protein
VAKINLIIDQDKKDLTDNQQTALNFLNGYIATGTTFQKGICMIVKRLIIVSIKHVSE